MSIFNKLFGSKPDPHNAIAFIDYEYWYYSYHNHFEMTPDPDKWASEIRSEFEMRDLMIFGDFSKNGMAEERERLQAGDYSIVDTRQPSGRSKKDITAFSMLDQIYQKTQSSPEVGTIILFAGDGRFQSVVEYLVNVLNRRVIVYGIKETVSNRLKRSASEIREFEEHNPVYEEYARLIVANMVYVSEHPQIIPTFNGTVTTVTKRNKGVSEEQARKVLQRMIDQGLVERKERVLETRTIRVLTPNWDALKRAGLYEDNKQIGEHHEETI